MSPLPSYGIFLSWPLLKMNKHLKFLNTYSKEICFKKRLWLSGSCWPSDFLNAAFMVGLCFIIWTQSIGLLVSWKWFMMLSVQTVKPCYVVCLCETRFQLQCHLYYVYLVFLDFVLLTLFILCVYSCLLFCFSFFLIAFCLHIVCC